MNPAVHLKLGSAYRQAGRVAEAERSLRVAVKLNPADKQARQALEQVRSELNTRGPTSPALPDPTDPSDPTHNR
jgi:hypothetical protein